MAAQAPCLCALAVFMSIFVGYMLYVAPPYYGSDLPQLFGAIVLGSGWLWCCGGCGLCARGSVQKNSRAYKPDTLGSRRLSTRPTKLTTPSSGPPDTTGTKPGLLESNMLQDFTRTLPRKENVFQSDKLAPSSMIDRARQAVQSLGLHCAIDETTVEEGHVRGRVAGYGSSETIGKSMAVDITVSSVLGVFDSLCIVGVYSEDSTECRLLNDKIYVRLTGSALPDESSRPSHRPQKPTHAGFPDQEVTASGRLELTDELVRFVVEVMNKSDHPIYAVRVRLASYPSDVMRLASTGEATLSRMGVGSSHRTLIELVPTVDRMMTGEIVAQVIYADAKEELHTLAVTPTPLGTLQDLRVS